MARKMIKHFAVCLALATAIVSIEARAQNGAASGPAPQEGDFVIHDFHFQSGETLADEDALHHIRHARQGRAWTH